MHTIDREAGLLEPGDPGFEAATAVFNLAAPARPAVAIHARSVEQVQRAIAYADRMDLPVRVHGTGHGSAARRSIDGGLLIRADLDGGVDIDSAARIARIPAGTRWRTVVDAAAACGLAAPHGSSPTVGVVGYLLGGGLSFYGRRKGVAANSVVALELVCADGRLLRVDASHDPGLFWALRGGGGGLGVVTAVELRLFPVTSVATGAAFWSGQHASRLMQLWRRWTVDAPEQLTTSLRLLNLPAVPGVPAVLTGGTVLCVDGAALAEPDEDERLLDQRVQALLAPLQAVAEPLLNTWQPSGPAAVLEAHLDPADPLAVAGDHLLLDEIGDDGAEEILRVAGPGSDSPLVVAGLRQLGGAYSRRAAGGGALSHFDARYAFAASSAVGPANIEPVRLRLALLRRALANWDTKRTAPTFVENFEQPQGNLRPDQVAAVDLIRRRLDPAGRFGADVAPNATAIVY